VGAFITRRGRGFFKQRSGKKKGLRRRGIKRQKLNGLAIRLPSIGNRKAFKGNVEP